MAERIVLTTEEVDRLRVGARDPKRPTIDRVSAGYAVLMGGDSAGSVAGMTVGDMMRVTGLSVEEVQDGLAALKERVAEDEESER